MGFLVSAPIASLDYILSDDCTLPDDPVFNPHRHDLHLTPHHALLYALLVDALHILVSTPHNRRHFLVYQEPLHWLHSDARTEFCTDFRTVCDYLHLDALQIRHGIERLCQRPARPLMRREYVQPLSTAAK